ncbi:hypothetical protein O3Q52_06260 [Streptomyces sp. ActVer]|nr:hypothetical protein [Streptomyces sp. ActVer]MCZ4507814.1 hypothetical protein [Streptomyces sp. ActVer]
MTHRVIVSSTERNDAPEEPSDAITQELQSLSVTTYSEVRF